jgi:hypothetical protein
MFAGLKTLGLTDKDEALTAISGWVDRQVSKTDELSAADTKVVLDHIDVLIAAQEAEAKEAEAAGDQADEEGGPEGAEPDGQ